MKLFEPLGITAYDWSTDKNGICNSNGLSMSAYDLAKLSMRNLQYYYEMEYKLSFSGNRIIEEIYSPAWGLCEKIEGVMEE